MNRNPGGSFPLSRRQRRRSLVTAFILGTATLGLYASVRRFGFVYLDDDYYIVKNTMVNGGLTSAGIRWAFSKFYVGNWHPLTFISHMIDVEIFGLSPGAHHMVNAGLHAFNAAVLFRLLLFLTGAFWRSILVTALFAAHPLHVESVAWVSERKDLLSSLFGLSAILLYVRHLRRPKSFGMAFVAAVYALSLMSKQMLVTLPILLLILDFWPLGRTALFVLEKLPLFILSAGAAAIAFSAQEQGKMVKSFQDYPLSVRAANALTAYFQYLWKAVWPAELPIFYIHQGFGIASWKPLTGALFLSGVTLAAMTTLKRHPYAAMGWFWYLCSLAPVIGIIQIGWQSMADRYTYLPLIGPFITVSWGLERAAYKERRRLLPVSASVIAIIVLSIRTSMQLPRWKNAQTLQGFSHKLVKYSQAALAAYDQGQRAVARGNTVEASEHFRTAVAIQPNLAEAHHNLGIALADLGRIEEAVKELKTAIILRPEYSEAHANLAVILLRQGKETESREHLDKARSLRGR